MSSTRLHSVDLVGIRLVIPYEMNGRLKFSSAIFIVYFVYLFLRNGNTKVQEPNFDANVHNFSEYFPVRVLGTTLRFYGRCRVNVTSPTTGHRPLSRMRELHRTVVVSRCRVRAIFTGVCPPLSRIRDLRLSWIPSV